MFRVVRDFMAYFLLRGFPYFDRLEITGEDALAACNAR
jgi:hypothetical protein